ncbi:uncharacterized protein [Dysidea avara]|uniref:uncharacterized protein isoform X2 n=1 Tax=Dysidea avara TaxID=196820 RepID=UPI00332DDAC6
MFYILLSQLMADDEWTQFISVSCRTSYFYRLSVYNICSVSFLQWQLLPLKNLVCGNWSHFFWEPVSFLHTFYQQLTAATSFGTVNELSAFKNLFHLVCPYFTDHARIANKIVLSDYKILGLGYQCIRCFL